MENVLGHEPVMLRETLEALEVKPGGQYVDCTLGRGGHAAAIVQAGGEVLGMDADPEAVEATKFKMQNAKCKIRLGVVHANFGRLEEIVQARGFAPVDGVLFDLGLSSPQVDDPKRGFSFMKDGPLDMRFDPSAGSPAATLVNNAAVDELARIFRDYGEQPHPRRTAQAIEVARRLRPIETTGQLAAIIERAAGGRGRIHPATRVFQALRIAVNRELEQLQTALEQAVRILKIGGRLVVISFHSLEDRIVKTFMADEARGCLCPPRMPACVCGHSATLRLVTRKPLAPEPTEVARNPRARSAKLRAAERI